MKTETNTTIEQQEVAMTKYTCEMCNKQADTAMPSDLAQARTDGEISADIYDTGWVDSFCWACGTRFTTEEAAEVKAEAEAEFAPNPEIDYGFRKGQNLRLPISKVEIGDEIDGKPIANKQPNRKVVTFTFEDGSTQDINFMARISIFRPLAG